VGKAVVVTLDGEVVMAPIIKSRIPGGQISLELDYATEAQRSKLLAMAGWQETPEELPGTARIKLTARFADGSKPVNAACIILPFNGYYPEPAVGKARPRVVGKDGDWVIHNVPPGKWWIEVDGDDCARIGDGVTVVLPAVGPELLVPITLSRGGTVSGRVLRDHTGAPLAGATVSCASRRATTDDEGRFRLTHVGSGTRIAWTQEGRLTLTPLEPARVRVVVMGDQAPDLIFFIGEDFDLAEGQSLTLPDIRMLRGGWVVGHVARPKGARAGEKIVWSISPIPQGPDPKGWQRHREFSDEQGRFRFRLPAGEYWLDVVEELRKGKGQRRWAGGLRGITVQAGKTTRELVVPVGPAR
jgi:hypothetical protein